MTYHFEDLKEEFLRDEEVYMPIENLQPIQIGRCFESQERINNGDITDKILVWPIDSGENYALIDGLHTTLDEYEYGKRNVPVYISHDLNSQLLRFYDQFGIDADFSMIEQWADSEISEIQLKADFIRSEKGVYHVRDTEILYPTTKELLEMNDKEFDKWVMKNAR